MAITYLSGERIQGSGAASRIITDDLTSDKASWADSSTTGNGWEDSTNDAVDFKMIATDDDNTDHGYVYTDLQYTNYLDGDNIDETAFTVKCHVRFSALANTTSGENRAYFGFFSSTAWGGTAQDFFALQLAVKQNQDPEFVLGYGNNSTFESAPNKNGTAFTAEAEVATDYYITFTKTGGTTYKIRVTTSSDYTGGQEMTATVSNITSLRYFGWKGRGDGQNNGGNTQGYFNDISITSGTTDEKTTITNVPLGTRYEETDTRKIFRGVEVDATGDYELGTEAAGITTDPSWTNVSGSNVSYDATNDELDVNPSGNNYGANTGYYIDLNAQITGSISETAWVLRFKFVQQTWTENTGTSGLNSVFLALQSSTNPSSNHDYVSTGIHNYSTEPQGWFFRGQENTGNNNPVGNSTLVLTPSASTTYWGEMKRVSATSVECRFYTNADFTGTPAGSTTDTITSGLNGLQYLSIWGLMQTNAGTNYNNVSFKWFKFWNGVTTPPQTIGWREKGTA